MHSFGDTLTTGTGFFLFIALALALSFEFVNGFHDTANAVATVIYTHSLRANVAVVWSGCWNLLGVLVSSGAVAFSVTALLPVELVLNVGSAAGFAMVFALLISAIIWNLGTWYLGLPASSSHTMIGSILGVGLANSMLAKGEVFGEGVNWAKASEVGASLLISPIIGFCSAGLLLLLARRFVRRPALFKPPPPGAPPPRGIRGLLILTCTGVSFAHGSNDGQKGMGLIMLILVGILPGMYALNLQTPPAEIAALAQVSQQVAEALERVAPAPPRSADAAVSELSSFLKLSGSPGDRVLPALAAVNRRIAGQLTARTSMASLSLDERRQLRSNLYLIAESISKLRKSGLPADPTARTVLADCENKIDLVTRFIPLWVKIAVAVALGLGTMIGWKRIVVTVGEKIGKQHLNYAQGASAELVAMATIGLADFYGLPVSTTHVLSSGVAGTMAANHSGLQMNTLRNLALAWVLTLPVCIFLGAAVFALGLNLILALGLR
jgi:PiT family inorganic phosphate transporter